jgi:hypothetical protein
VAENERLKKQLVIMRDYANILHDRIDDFTDGVIGDNQLEGNENR